MSTIKNLQHAMQYTKAGDRKGCGNCVHVTESKATPTDVKLTFFCEKGKFYVSKLAICGQFCRKPKAVAAEAAMEAGA